MLRTSRLRLTNHLTKVATLSTLPKPDTQTNEDSLLQWLSSPSATPPPNTQTRFQFQSKNSKISVNKTPLTGPQSLQASTTLLSSQTLHRSPYNLPPLTVKFSSPNIAKPLHLGHLRSTITGLFIKKITKFAGHECRSICFLGDWGRQFGVLHAGVLEHMKLQGKTQFNEYVGSLTLQALLYIYVEASKKCSESKDFTAEALRLSAELEENFNSDSNGKFLWSNTRSITVDHLKSVYSDLGITFDEFQGESTYNRDSSHTNKALRLLESTNLSFRHEDGSLRVKLGDKDLILLKRDNSSVYLLRDISCAIHRSTTHKNHKFVYVVDQGQSNHFQNLFEILRNLNLSKKDSTPPFTSTHVHVPFGKVEGMSTRSGNFVLLSEVIEQGTHLMHESRKKSKNARNTEDMDVSKRLAISGLIVNALKVRRNKTYAFDWNEALRSNGNSGVALQYTIARLESLVKRITGGDEVDDTDVCGKFEILFESGGDELLDLIVCVMNFEDTFWRSYTLLEPSTLVSYSFNLTDKISKALSTLNVMNEKNRDLANAALWLFHVSKMRLENCMRILGIQTVGEF